MRFIIERSIEIRLFLKILETKLVCFYYKRNTLFLHQQEGHKFIQHVN